MKHQQTKCKKLALRQWDTSWFKVQVSAAGTDAIHPWTVKKFVETNLTKPRSMV